jgi:hypothetical protein
MDRVPTKIKVLILILFGLAWVFVWIGYVSHRSNDCDSRGGVLVRDGFGLGWSCVKPG